MLTGPSRDQEFMRRALALAEQGWGQTAPNPLVGAVVVQDGMIVGEGHHARFGGPHAEPVALRAAGDRARGGTLYVTLEPCVHHGKTPPCVDAILAAGIARVVVAASDPGPMAGGGAKILRAAGLDVVTGVEAAAARELNAPFFFALQADRPWITLKLALSLDGALTDANRSSAWLTSPPARAWVHHLRAGSDAIAVGIGTVICDDPQLTVRDVPSPRTAPRPVVFDDRLETPLEARLLRGFAVPDLRGPSPGGPLVVATRGAAHAPTDRVRALEAAGATVVVADSLHDALRTLREAGIRSLLVEGGAGVAGALLEAAVVDRLVIFQAPVLLGQGALNAFAHAPAGRVADAPRLRVVDRRTFGDDLMTVFELTPL